VTEHVDGAGPPVPDIRLVESTDGWLLTMTDATLTALLASRDGTAVATAQFLVQVEPNLVPGDPFPTDVLVTELAPEHS
jgi:hypothetical protein